MKLDGVRPYNRQPKWQQAFDSVFKAATLIGMGTVAIMGVLLLTGQV
ncbi:MAG: hypothetical protein AAGC81_03810 [Pseudomonadota bacterium]